MLRITALIFFLVVSMASQHSYGQFKKIKTVTLNYTPHAAAVDRPGELYLLEGKRIEQYSPGGVLQQKGELPFVPDIFEPRDGSKMFAFSRRENTFLFFSPMFAALSEARPQKADSAFAIHPYFVCSAGDHDLVILDSADWSLKKINLRTNRMIFESVISDSSLYLNSISYVREYQNFVFMLDKNRGILIFNMLGKLLKTIPARNINYFNFLGEELYFLDKDKLVFFDLFNTESRSIKLPYPPDLALITDENLFLVRTRRLEVFSLKP
jgi:hypothetical protein